MVALAARARPVPDGGDVDGLPPGGPRGRRRAAGGPVRHAAAAARRPRVRRRAAAGDRMRDPALGAGALLDMGIYPLTFADLMLGPADVARRPPPCSTTRGVDLDVAIAGAPRGRCRLRADRVDDLDLARGRPRIATDRGRIDLPADFHHPPYAVWTPTGGEPERIERRRPVLGHRARQRGGRGRSAASREGLRREPAGAPRADPAADARRWTTSAPGRRALPRRRGEPHPATASLGSRRGLTDNGRSSSSSPTGCRSTGSTQPDGSTELAALPRRPGHRPRAGDARQRRRLDRLAGRHRDRPRAVRGGRPVAGPDRRCQRGGDRGLLRGLLQRHAVADLPRPRRQAGVPPGVVGQLRRRSTAASPTRPPRSPRRARRSGSTTTSSSWCRRCCASCGPTCGSASTCTSRSRRPSCSSSCRGGARSSRACSGPTWSASSSPAAPANFVRLVRQRVGHKTHRDLVYLPDGRTVRAGGVPDLDRHAGFEELARSEGVERARDRDPRGPRRARARSSSASTGSTTPRASTPGCAPSAS